MSLNKLESGPVTKNCPQIRQHFKFKTVRSVLFLSQIIFALIFIGCEESDLTSPCGVKNPIKDIEWLSDLVETAKNDTTGEYIGNIWITTFETKDYIISDMAMGAGGRIFRCYNCSGEIDNVSDYAFFSTLSDDDIVYSNVP